uniref:Uncharacterized protein n=1 Tax=viral metagenome TaxID=1070528 RepID=A0A6M3KMT1_9ZZZZ
MRTRPERQHRYFKAKAIKWQRKLNRLGERALEPDKFSKLMIEGQSLLTFITIDAISREGMTDG